MPLSQARFKKDVSVPAQWAILGVGFLLGPPICIFWTLQGALGAMQLIVLATVLSALWFLYLADRPSVTTQNKLSSEALFLADIPSEIQYDRVPAWRQILGGVGWLSSLVGSAIVFQRLSDIAKICLVMLGIYAVRRVLISIYGLSRQALNLKHSPKGLGTDQQFVVLLATRMMTYTLIACALLHYASIAISLY